MHEQLQGTYASTNAPKRKDSISQLLRTWWSWFMALYDRAQVSCHGQYSLEHLHALDEYCKKTSLTRALCVCIGTPFPMLIVVLLAENIPLCSPSDGWAKNYWFWVRFYALVATITLSILVQAKTWISELPLTKLKMVALAVVMPIPLVALDPGSGISPLYQVAFVLESQMLSVQAKGVV
ncbi:Hypothetical protein PHPALM_13473 [Globisporangium polare]